MVHMLEMTLVVGFGVVLGAAALWASIMVGVLGYLVYGSWRHGFMETTDRIQDLAERLKSSQDEAEQMDEAGFVCRNWLHPRDFGGHSWIPYSGFSWGRWLAQGVVRVMTMPLLWFAVAGTLGAILVLR